jgi:hypothetical protein
MNELRQRYAHNTSHSTVERQTLTITNPDHAFHGQVCEIVEVCEGASAVTVKTPEGKFFTLLIEETNYDHSVVTDPGLNDLALLCVDGLLDALKIIADVKE